MPWRFLIGLWMFLVVVTSVPPILSWMQRPAGGQYTGNTVESAGDVFNHLSLIDQARLGRVMLPILMVPAERPVPSTFHPLFLVLGYFANAAHIPTLVMWHLARDVMILLFVILLWRFLDYAGFSNRMTKWLVFGITTTGGLFWVNHESSVFASLAYTPLGTATLSLTLGYFLLFLKNITQSGTTWQRIALLHLIALLQAMIHPYILPLWLGVALIFLLVRWMQTQRFHVGAFFLVISSIGLSYAYLAWSVYRDPVLRSFIGIFRVSGLRWEQALSYLVVLPLVVVGIIGKRTWLRSSPFGTFMLTWLTVNVLLLLSPYPYAGRTLITIYLPLGFFCALGFAVLWQHAATSRLRYSLLFIIPPLLSANALQILVNATGSYVSAAPYRYLSGPAARGMLWIRENLPSDATFVTSPAWDTLFAQASQRRAYFTSGGFTADYHQRIATSLQIYHGEFSADGLRSFLRSYNIQYVLVSNLERKPPTWIIREGLHIPDDAAEFRFQPSKYPFLSVVYDKDGFTIYHITSTDLQ